MSLLPKSLAFIMFILFAISTTWFFKRASEAPVAPSPASPDAYMSDASAIILDQTGQPKIKIIAAKMVHFAENDQARFTQPTIVIYRKTDQPWFFQAKYAQTVRGLNEIFFWQNVVASHAADQKGPAATIKTPELTVDTQMKIAKTSTPITFVQSDLVIKSIGMIANLQNSRVQLLSQTQAFYLPDDQ